MIYDVNDVNKENYENQETKEKNSNKVAIILRAIAIIGGIIAFCIGMSEDNIFLVCSSIISAIFLYSYAEIIQLLEDIKNNTKKD